MYLNLEKFIDKLEPSDSQSAFGSKNYYGNVVNDTIQEEEISEHDDADQQQDERGSTGSYLSSHSSRRKRGYSMLDGQINPLSLNFVRNRTHRISKSAIAYEEYETIKEELEEYEF